MLQNTCPKSNGKRIVTIVQGVLFSLSSHDPYYARGSKLRQSKDLVI